MIRNYLKIALRNLLKYRGFSAINLFGLTTGFTAVILILLYVHDEMSYDRYSPETEYIYRIYWQSGNPQTRTPHPMAQALVNDFPEVVSATSLSPIWGAGLTPMTFSVRNLERDIRYDEKNVLSVDSTFLNVFPFKLLKGNPNKVLRTPGKILLSQTFAKKYFGDDDPIGKHLAFNGDENLAEVEGVFEDVPRQAHFHFDILVSYVHMKAVSNPQSDYYTWSDFGHFNYIKLMPGADQRKLEAQLMKWATKYITVSDEDFNRMLANNEGFRLQNIRTIHLKSNLRWELEANGNIEYVYIMAAAAFIILFIASINFMNLTTAKSSERAKEIGIRRTLGAIKSQLSLQFIGEASLLAVFSALLAGVAIEILLPLFNQLTGKQIDFSILSDPRLIGGILAMGMVTGFLAGVYPSFILSSINPVTILKGKYTNTKRGSVFVRGLVVFQFTMAIILVSATFVIYNQLHFIQNRNLGFTKDAVVTIPIRTRATRAKLETIKTEFLKIPRVSHVGASSNAPGGQFNQNPIFTESDPQNRVDASQMYVDYDLVNTLGLNVLEGRFFERAFPADTANAFVINKTAANNLQLTSPVGAEIILEDDGEFVRGTVVGVLEDFHYQSLHQSVRPLLMQLRPYYNTVFVKLNTTNLAQTMHDVEKAWLLFEEGYGFNFSFLEETIQSQYQAENRMGVIFGLFGGVAIVIASLGLFGLASLNYAQRKKEVGIRKVLGANMIHLLTNLVKGYSKLIILATLLSIPLTWIIMNDWLNHFRFKTEINLWIFLFTGLATLLVSWTTIGYLTMKTAASNPVDVLKEE